MMEARKQRQARHDGRAFATIWFEGRELPPWASTLDVAALPQFIGQDAANRVVSGHENTRLFWWRFSICVGRLRKARSSDVIDEGIFLGDQLQREKANSIRQLGIVLPDERAEVIYADWIEGLEIIRQMALKAGKECRWYGGYQGSGRFDGDPVLAPPWEETSWCRERQRRAAGRSDG
jgi:hypothetical protein